MAGTVSAAPTCSLLEPFKCCCAANCQQILPGCDKAGSDHCAVSGDIILTPRGRNSAADVRRKPLSTALNLQEQHRGHLQQELQVPPLHQPLPLPKPLLLLQRPLCLSYPVRRFRIGRTWTESLAAAWHQVCMALNKLWPLDEEPVSLSSNFKSCLPGKATAQPWSSLLHMAAVARRTAVPLATSA